MTTRLRALRRAAVLLLAVPVLLLAACAGTTPEPADTPTPTATQPTPTEAPSPAPTSPPAATPTEAPSNGGAEPAPDPESPEAAVAVLEEYFEAIDAGEYERAYGLWQGEGAASGQTFDEFRAGYAQTAGVTADIGEPGRIEGAAGSRYIEVPVEVTATTTTGDTQHFEGTYVLRRAVVDGATAEERLWRIYSATIVER